MNRWVNFGVLKQSMSIEQVLASYRVQLKHAGHHQLRGPCPLPTHGSERSRQSFSVDIVKNVWACHSHSCCVARQGRVGGNILDLVALLEGCTIRDAALGLQDRGFGWRAGIGAFEHQLASKGSSASRPDRLPQLTFSLQLRCHPYLDQRGIQPSTAAWFGIGHYAGSGFLRHRIVFPIHDSEGHLVAYAGRSIDGSEPRYLFPPGFRKSQVVFNLHRTARESTGYVVVVEGFFDCLRVHQAGFHNVVALMGVSLSKSKEILLLERFQHLVLMLDADESGRQATQQLAARLWGKVSLFIVGLPNGRQPDQLSSEEIQRILCRVPGAFGA